MTGQLDLAAAALRNAAKAVPVEALSGADEQLSAVAASVQQAGGEVAELLLSSIAARRAEADDLRKRMVAFRQELTTAAVDVANLGSGPPSSAPPTGKASSRPPAAVPNSPGRQPPDPHLIAQAQAAGHKINPRAVVIIGRNATGKLIRLETGNAKGGLTHMATGKRGGEFEQAGVAAADIAGVVFHGAATGKPVGITGRDRVVYARRIPRPAAARRGHRGRERLHCRCQPGAPE